MLDVHLFLGRQPCNVAPEDDETLEDPSTVVYGSFAPDLIDTDCESIRTWVKDDTWLNSQLKPRANAYKAYHRSRSKASPQSSRRFKELPPAAVHPWFQRRIGTAEVQRTDMVNALKTFRPHTEIFRMRCVNALCPNRWYHFFLQIWGSLPGQKIARVVRAQFDSTNASQLVNRELQKRLTQRARPAPSSTFKTLRLRQKRRLLRPRRAQSGDGARTPRRSSLGLFRNCGCGSGERNPRAECRMPAACNVALLETATSSLTCPMTLSAKKVCVCEGIPTPTTTAAPSKMQS